MLDFDLILAGVNRGEVRFAATGGRGYGRVPNDTPPDRLAEARRKAQAEIEYLQQEMDALHKAMGLGYLIVGDARGLDELMRAWAFNRKISSKRFRADWDGQGRAAGLLRNLRMRDEGKPELLVRFPGGRGTAHMTRACAEVGIPVIRFTGPYPE